MKPTISSLSREYEAALREYLKSRSNSGLKKAAMLGAQAVSLGLETLDLAKLHEQALVAIGASNSADAKDGVDGLARRAQTFFVEVNILIERTHAAAARVEVSWSQLNEILHERTTELAVSKREVKMNVVQRKAAEKSLRTKNEYYTKLLKESQAIQANLRRLAHRVLSAQEYELGKISRELHEEIAQVLLGISMHLLTLEQKGSLDAKKLLNDIASTRRLVDKSIRTMRRMARKFRTPHEKQA